MGTMRVFKPAACNSSVMKLEPGAGKTEGRMQILSAQASQAEIAGYTHQAVTFQDQFAYQD